VVNIRKVYVKVLIICIL